MIRHRPLGLLGAVLLVACADEPVLERWQGEHVEFGFEEGLTPCGGTREHMDRVIPFYAAQLGLDVATFEPINYAWLSDEGWRATVPEKLRPVGGIADGSRAYGRRAHIVHELAHTVVHQGSEGGLSFFREGIAEALDDVWTSDGVRYPRVDPRPQLDRNFPELHYSIAGAFVAYLLARGGPETFFELLDRTDAKTSRDRLDAIFIDLYGADVDAVVAEYLTADACPEDAMAIPLPSACMAPERPWAAPGRWVLAQFLECDDEDAVGGRSHGLNDDDGDLLLTSTLMVDDPGPYRLRLAGDYVRLSLVHCGGCPFLRQDVALNGPGEVEAELPAGRHAVTIYADPEARSQVAVALDRR